MPRRYDIAKARRELGYEPVVSFREGSGGSSGRDPPARDTMGGRATDAPEDKDRESRRLPARESPDDRGADAPCRHRPRLDLEKVTGIHERRVADGEYAKDLGIEAAERALAMSRYAAEDLDVVVCTSISKHHRPDEFSFEPATAVLVRRAIGAKQALVFDVVNACAGLLNGIWVLQGLIRSGAIRCGMVVSGEQNMPLAETATREVRHSLDRQLAALTLGDCGAAAHRRRRDRPEAPASTGSTSSPARSTTTTATRGRRAAARGGILMTKARGLQIKGAEHFPVYLKQALDATGWYLDDVDHVIPHQVSVRAIRHGIKVVSRFLGCACPTSTCRRREVRQHHDDQPFPGAARLHAAGEDPARPERPPRQRGVGHRDLPRDVHARRPPRALPGPRERRGLTCDAAASKASASARRDGASSRWGSLKHAVEAGERCLEASRYQPADVRVLVNAGVHRDGHVCEPAIAAYVQHALGINVDFHGRRTLAFDLLNGGVGMLNAAHLVAAQMLAGDDPGRHGGRERGQQRPPPRPGIDLRRERGGDAARRLAAKRGRLRRLRLRHPRGARRPLHGGRQPGGAARAAPPAARAELEDAYLAGASAAVTEALSRDGLRPGDVDVVVPAQISPPFLKRLPGAIGFPAEKVADFTASLPDTLTTSVFLALDRARTAGTLGPGKKALLLACGSGVTVAAVTYQF